MLAELAVGAGYEVLALDYFGDSDLRALCPSVSLLRDFAGKSYSPQALAAAARELRAPAVAYGASFENHPALVAELAQGRVLLGNPPEVLARVRQPAMLHAALAEGGFAFPQTVLVEAGDRLALPGAGRWLWKPLLSGGGHGVRVWRGGPAPGRGLLQAQVMGRVCSAQFAADGSRAVVLGLTEQLVGRRAFGATGFRYCGNVIPPRLRRVERASLLGQVRALAAHLAAGFGLRGVNGVDFIWREKRPWVLEVNARPTAALELLDSAYNIRTFDIHTRACAGELPQFDLAAAWRSGAPAAGKAILFARRDVSLGDTGGWAEHGIRDVPHPGEHIAAPHPICTLLATGRTPAACLRELRTKADLVRSWFLDGG